MNVLDTVQCLCEVLRWVLDSGLIDGLIHQAPKEIPAPIEPAYVTPLASYTW